MNKIEYGIWIKWWLKLKNIIFANKYVKKIITYAKNMFVNKFF